MRRVLMVSPYFPPETGAATHRVRLLAPHLPRYGWDPTVVSVDPRDYEGRLDPELAGLVPDGLRVVRCRAWSPQWTRRFGVGDLGIRAWAGLYRTCRDLLRRERFDALFITLFPTYPTLLGPLFKRRFGVPFVFDYIDPWVSEWGRSVGGGPGGKPDLKARLSRWLGLLLEPVAARAANAITAVSRGTYEQVRQRYAAVRSTPCAEIPYGGEPADFERVRRQPRPNPFFDPHDGRVPVCYVGTLLPLGFETLRAVFAAAADLRRRRPELAARLRFHFFGTSNQTAPDAPQRVLPVARQFGLEDCVTEVAPRIDYLDALTVHVQAGAILLLGSSERHYTASKLYPALLAQRPVLAVYHEESTVVEILRRTARPPAARCVTYNDTDRAESRVDAIARELEGLLEAPAYDPGAVRLDALHEVSAQALAGKLAAVFDRVTKKSLNHGR